MLGKKINNFKQQKNQFKHIAVKESVFPFSKFDGSDIILGPEMKSTGEAMGIDYNFGKAFAKSQLSANVNLPLKGNLFVSVKNGDKNFVYEHVKKLKNLGFKISATKGTANFLNDNNQFSNSSAEVLEKEKFTITIINKKKKIL